MTSQRPSWCSEGVHPLACCPFAMSVRGNLARHVAFLCESYEATEPYLSYLSVQPFLLLHSNNGRYTRSSHVILRPKTAILLEQCSGRSASNPLAGQWSRRWRGGGRSHQGHLPGWPAPRGPRVGGWGPSASRTSSALPTQEGRRPGPWVCPASRCAPRSRTSPDGRWNRRSRKAEDGGRRKTE